MLLTLTLSHRFLAFFMPQNLAQKDSFINKTCINCHFQTPIIQEFSQTEPLQIQSILFQTSYSDSKKSLRQSHHEEQLQTPRFQKQIIPKKQITFIKKCDKISKFTYYRAQRSSEMAIMTFYSLRYFLGAALKFRQRSFQFIINYEKIPMKAKPHRPNQNTIPQQVTDLSIEQSLSSQLDDPKHKMLQIKTDPTTTSFSQNQISTAFLPTRNLPSVKNEEEIQNNNPHHKKSRKSNKKKIIEKNIILTSRDRHGKSSRILKNKLAQKLKRKLLKAEKLKSATKPIKIKQNIIPTTPKPPIIKPKTLVIPKIDQKLQKINLDECADIKMIGFERKQLQKKRDDLLKRTVDDWNFIQKLRSDKRQLRILTPF